MIFQLKQANKTKELFVVNGYCDNSDKVSKCLELLKTLYYDLNYLLQYFPNMKLIKLYCLKKLVKVIEIEIEIYKIHFQ